MRSRTLLRLAAGLVLISLAGGEARAEHPPFRVYTTAEGLARDNVSCILQDSRGFVWFCTAEGLSRFDGYSFTNFGTDNGLPEPYVGALLETRDGTLWAGTADGLARFDPSAGGLPGVASPGLPRLFETFKPESPEGAANIRVLLESRDGSIWAGTLDGLFRFDRRTTKFERIVLGVPGVLPGQEQINALLEEPEGGIWIATRYLGLFHHGADGRLERFLSSFIQPAGNIRALAFDGAGGLWAGGWEGIRHLARSPNGGVEETERFTAKDNLPHDQVYALLRTAEGRIVAGTSLGIAILVPTPGGSWAIEPLTASQGLNVAVAISLAEDRSGNVWIGTTGSGAWKLARDGFTTFATADGFPGPYCRSFFRDRRGRLYASTHTADTETVLTRLEGSPFPATTVNIPATIHGRGWGMEQLTFQDHLGDWWVPTGEGLVRFSGVQESEGLATAEPSAIYTTRDGLTHGEIYRLYEDSRGDIWISAYGLSRWDRSTGRFHRLGPPDIREDSATAFGEDSSGNVWLGYWGSTLVRSRNGRFETFAAADGVPPGNIQTIFRDSLGRLWIGTTDGGVARVDDPAAAKPIFAQVSREQGLASLQVNAITEDRWGRIYLGTGRGVDVLEPDSGRLRHLTQADGLAGSDIQLAAADGTGALWFSTVSGVSRLIPRAPEPRRPPPVWISSLSIAGLSQPVSLLGEAAIGGVELAPDQDQIQVGFVGLDFSAGEKLRYQYRLEGGGSEAWSPPAGDRSVNFAHLAPGRYRFSVRAIDSDGQGSEKPATISFVVLPPIWQRGWFLALAAAAALALVTAIHRLRVRRLLEIERVRTRIASDLHDDMGASLSRIALQSELARRPEVIGPAGSERILADIGESARALVDSMSDIVWSIDPRRDDLSSLTSRLRQFALGILEPLGASFQMDVPEGAAGLHLTPEQRRHLYLILKEAINNIAKHAGCRRASLTIKVERGHLLAVVTDDGQGLEDAAGEPSTPAGQGGHGLQSLRARAEQIGGRLEVSSTPGEGTTLSVKCPIDRRSA